MNTRLISMALLASLLGGCAHRPAIFAATWYLQGDSEEAKPYSLYVALLNRSHENQHVEGLVLNSAGGDIGHGWTLRFDVAHVQPGALLVRRVNDFTKNQDGNPATVTWPQCMLPIDMVVLFHRDGSARVPISAQLPGVLPRGWEHCPEFPAPKPPK
jgi:hypothetical protein